MRENNINTKVKEYTMYVIKEFGREGFVADYFVENFKEVIAEAFRMESHGSGIQICMLDYDENAKIKETLLWDSRFDE